MLRRKIYDTLLKWKKTKEKECLLIRGARQIGKTYIITAFGKKEYKSFIYLNFYEHPELKEVFAESLDAETIYKKISLQINDKKYIENNTLIFLDEIQECPQARTSLKFLAIDGRFDVIASGSMLGIAYQQTASLPVGYERIVDMYALDFEEFLWACGKEKTAIDVLKEYFTKQEAVPNSIHDMMLGLLREYLVLGGMPEVIKVFLKKNSFAEAFSLQKKILESYRADIQKYASVPERQKIQDCYFSIPRQLSKDYTKFQYKVVDSKGSARRYENSLNWLVDAGMIQLCQNVSVPEFPLVAYEMPNQFKVYVTDIGLLTAMFGNNVQIALLKNELKGPAKGGIYENLVFDMLLKRDFKLHYYKNSQSTQEIEFIYESNTEIIPVEVKAKNGATPSLNSFLERYKPKTAYKLIAGNVGVNEQKITLPLYMAMFL